MKILRLLPIIGVLVAGSAWGQGTIPPGNGVVPYSNGSWGQSSASGGNGSVFLAGDGTWKTPGGGGGSGTVTSIGTGTGLTGGTITTSGTISCVTFGSSLVGCVPASGGGTTNFLRADGAWAPPPGGGGFTTNNVIPKGNGSTLVASGFTDNGTTVTTSENAVVGALQVTNQAGSGARCIHVDAAGNQSPTSGDCGSGGSGSVTSLSQGTGMSFSTNPITTTGTIGLANTGVTAGSYTSANITVDAQGRLTSATNGSGGGGVSSVGLSVPGSSLFGVTGSPVTSSGTLGLTTTGTSGGIPYFSSSSALSSSGTMAQYGVMIGGGTGATPVTVTPGTSGFVLTSNGPAANPTFQAAAGGGTAVASYGTWSGAVNVYTTTGTTPAVSANTDGYRFCGFFPSSLASNTSTATLAVGTAPAAAVKVKSAANGAIALAGGEMQPGANGNPLCAQYSSTAVAWILDSQAPGNQATNPTSPYSITLNDWGQQKVFLQTTGGTTYNLPAAGSTISSQAGVTIQTIGVTAQLCATGSDVINSGLLTGASTAGGCITLPADGVFPINTSGSSGTTAWSVALGGLQYFTLTWAEGLNLSTNARYVSRFASPKVIYGIKCNVQAAAGSASTVHLFSTPSGTTPASGTALDTTGCNANTASNTEQDMGVASSGLGTTTPGYTIWATFSGSGTSGNGGLTITYR